MIPLFTHCGHPRSAENTRIGTNKNAGCRTCHNRFQREYNARIRAKETPSQRFERHRLRYLPVQLEAARRKVAMLEREARRLGIEAHQ